MFCLYIHTIFVIDLSFLPEIRFGAREHMLPVFWTKFKKSKKIQKITKKIMHVPEHGVHRCEKFRIEMSSYAPWTKMTISDSKFKFSDLICCQKFVIFAQGTYDNISVRNFSRRCAPCLGTCVIFFVIF